ncbi:hypothetical protein KY289_037407 [Solanum tuberosum]|nr:hypothetical protein KY289_037407 [Solanum tuberosum]
MKIFAREALFSLASAIGTPLQVDKATTGVVKEVLQKIVYAKFFLYCTTCKHHGHNEEECRLTMEIEGGLIEETKINGEKLEGDLRSILDEKKKVLTLQQTGKEVTLPNSSNINSGKNSVDNLNKEKHTTTTIQERVNAPRLLRLTATSGHKEDTEAMLLRTLTSKISEQLGAAATGSSTPVHIDIEAQNNADNNSRELIVYITSRYTVVIVKIYFGQYEGLHGTAGLSAESGNTLDLEKQIEQMGKLKKRCHDDHTDQQALVTHEKESIVTEEIDGKEINPNTPAMYISNQEAATIDLNDAKEKQGV